MATQAHGIRFHFRGGDLSLEHWVGDLWHVANQGASQWGHLWVLNGDIMVIDMHLIASAYSESQNSNTSVWFGSFSREPNNLNLDFLKVLLKV